MKLSITSLVKEYKNKNVLDIPELTIDQGNIYSLIGPNGAGKSTFIKIIAGIDKPTSGNVLYDDNIFCDNVRMKTTLLFQKPYMLNCSVFENIAYPLRIRYFDSSAINKRVDEFLGILDLHGIQGQRAMTLSGGEAQKVALARALVFKPELVLLDEPTASIDPVSTLLIENLVRQVNKEHGTTFIWVTHDIGQAKRTAQRVLFMHKGKVVEWGMSEKVLGNPDSDITKRFVSGELVF